MDATLHQFPLFARSPRLSKADVDVHALSRPAGEFTGDFYFTHRHRDTLWLAIGDVAGKGIHAAVFMAMIQEELEHRIASCAMQSCDPAITMTRLDLFLRTILPPNRFATAAIAQIRDDGTLVVTNAGHCPLLLGRRDGSIETIDSTGPVAGILPSPHWRSIEMPFRRGDTLLAYTDGVTEARSQSGEEFGLARLRDAFEKAIATARRSRDIGAALTSALSTHAGAKRDDDLTIIVARR